MIGPWTDTEAPAWAIEWRRFVDTAEFVAELRGGDFDVWTALAEAIAQWLDAAAEQPASTHSYPDPDRIRSAMQRLLNEVPPGGAPGGHALCAVLSAAIDEWTEAGGG